MRVLLLIGASLALASATGYLAAAAISQSSEPPTETVTVSITGVTGPPGPAGPAGPAGPPGEPGAESCPTGSTFKAVRFIIQGQGPTEIWTCVAN